MISKSQDFHRVAMRFAEQAVLAKRADGQDAARELFLAALGAELMAIDQFTGEVDRDPTLAVLARSAATLALDCGEPEIAARVASAALEGSPPPEIETELLQVLARAAPNRNKGAEP